MITTFSDYSQCQSTPLNNEQEKLIGEYLVSYRPKICCIESYWNQGMTDTFSVKPFLKAIGWMINKDIVLAHRIIESGKGLSHYTQFPDGLIWQDPNLAGIDVFYIAMHGKPGGLMTYVDEIESEELISAFKGLDQSNSVVYFGGCEVLGGEKGKLFAEELIKKTGTVAVIGYSELAGWVDSLMIDTLFLSRFFELEGNPFERLQEIYDSVLKDYPRARECGFSLCLNRDQIQ
jgi:hypothetical protein